MPRLTSATDRNILSYFDDSKRLVAKLMARENITVVIVDGAPTASFDTVARVLSLPNWPFVNVDQYDTQLCHEVGHALYTDNSYLEKLATRRSLNQATAGLFTYINVIEDTRIERKMREAYPGVTRIFYNGRKAFAESGPIFQVADAKHVLIDGKKIAVKGMKFIDRINMFYKIGAFIDVPFTAAEQAWFPVINRCFSTENAVTIAEALHKLAKETDQQQKQEQGQQQKQKQQKQQGGNPEQGQQGGDEGESGDEGEEAEGEGKAKGSKGEETEGDGEGSEAGQDGSEGDSSDDSTDGDQEGQGGDEDSKGDSEGDGEAEGEGDGDDDGKGESSSGHAELGQGGDSSDAGDDADGDGAGDPASETDAAMERALEALAKLQQRSGADIRNLLLKPISDKATKERTVTAMEWASLVEKSQSAKGVDTGATAKLEAKWNELYASTAKHMASEFTRKKTAKNLVHARTAKTGRLNMNRLASYQITDDLFKHVTTVPNGQSHGVVMVIDGSSSMDDVFGSVIDQTLLFAKFAFQCNIPFEAYMFTDRHHASAPNFSTEHEEGVQVLGLSDSGRLVGLINTVADRKGFNRQVRACLALRAVHSKDAITAAAGYGSNFNSVPYGNLGGTPLYSGMMIMERHVERMKRSLRLDKVTAIVVTDGQDTAQLRYTGNTTDRTTGKVTHQTEQLRGQAVVVRDTKTKKNFMLVEKNEQGNNYVQPRNATLAMLFDVMKERHDARTVMLFLVENDRDAHGAAGYMTRGDVKLDAGKITTDMAHTKQFVIPADKGVADCSIILNTSSLVLQENTFGELNTQGMTASDITKEFITAGRKAGANRVFVNTVIPFIA